MQRRDCYSISKKRSTRCGGGTAAREPLQQLRDYVGIIVIMPACLIGAAALTTAGQSLGFLRAAGEMLGVSSFLDQLIGVLGPLAALFVGLTFLYKVMPHTKVRLASAALGALVGGLLWYLVLIVHVRFQVGVASYNALYSGFGAIPIFLAWLDVSWLVVLVGAQIAAKHQTASSLPERTGPLDTDQAGKELLGLAAALSVARAFLSCDAPVKLSKLSTELDVSERLLGELLGPLVRARILVRATDDDEPAFVLGRPTECIRVKDVLDVLRHAHASDTQDRAGDPELQTMARELWRELDTAAAKAPANRSLREILESAD
jgi:membrane protein